MQLPRSITLRLTFLFAIGSTVVLLGLGLWVSRAVEQHFIELDNEDLDSRIDLVAIEMSGPANSTSDAALSKRLQAVTVGQHGQMMLRVNDSQGQLLYASPNAHFPDSLPPARQLSHSTVADVVSWKAGDMSFRGKQVVLPTDSPNLPGLSVAVALDTYHHDIFFRAFQRALSAAVGAGILLVALIGWVAARRGMSPVRDLARVARNTSASRLHDRLKVELLPTELVGVGSAFNEMLGRLEASFRRLSELSSDMAHELRTPISNLMTNTHVALSRVRTTVEYQEALYSNLEEYERLAKTISDMLFLAKADNGTLLPSQESVALEKEVDSLFEFYDALAEERGLQLRRTGTGTVVGDPLMVRRAVANLLSNAIRYADRGSPVDVSIANNDESEIVLAVGNRGPVIPNECLHRLFDRFYRVDPSRQGSASGSGLGLAITKSIMVAHRGSVAVVSEHGLTTFRLHFPAPDGRSGQEVYRAARQSKFANAKTASAG